MQNKPSVNFFQQLGRNPTHMRLTCIFNQYSSNFAFPSMCLILPHAGPHTPASLHLFNFNKPTWSSTTTTSFVELSCSQPCNSNDSELVEISSPFPFAISHFPSSTHRQQKLAILWGMPYNNRHFPSSILGFFVELDVLWKIGVYVGILCMVLVV